MRGTLHRVGLTLAGMSLVVAACSAEASTGSTVDSAVVATTSAPVPTTTSEASTTTTTAATAAAVAVLAVPFDLPPDADVDQMAEAMAPIFSPYPEADLVEVGYADGSLLFSIAGAIPLGLCEDLFNAVGAGDRVLDCTAFAQGAPPNDPAATDGLAEADFPAPDMAAAAAAVDATVESVVLLLSEGQPVGTGFFIGADGVILTNRHVVEGKQDLQAMLLDGRVLPAATVGVVTALRGNFDIAVVQVAGDGFPVVAIGDPHTLERGDVLLQLGNPLGYGYWLATGGHFLGLHGGDVVSTAVGDTGFSGSPMFDDDGSVVALLWGETSGREGVIDFGLNPPTPPASVDVIWSFEEFQAEAATRVNTAGVPIDTALEFASMIIERGRDVSPADLVLAQVRVEGTTVIVPAPVDAGTFGVPEFVQSIQEVVLSRYPGSQIADLSLNGTEATFEFDVLPSEEALREIIDLLVGAFGAVSSLDLSQPLADRSFAAPEQDEAIRAAAERKLSSVVALTFPFGSSATGFLITDDGYILTNAHNVSSDPAAPIVAVMSDGTQLPARLVGYDRSGNPDVAVLDVDGSGYPEVSIADPGALAPGDTVFVIGNPAGYGFWLTSAGEYLGPLGPDDKPDSFATTASASAGNSGSPFFDASGDVIGLLWGNANDPIGAFERTISEVLWDPAEFWDLKVHGSAGHPIDIALQTAFAIIDRGGDVP